MDKKETIEGIKKARAESKKRKFDQRVDLIINLKNLDFKKPDHQVDLFVNFSHPLGKNKKICALVGPELKDEAAKVCDLTILAEDFPKYRDEPKKTKKVADENDFFIAQANIMPQVATTFGRVLGPKNKMPNPKAGCIVSPKANLKPLYEKLQKTARITAKKDQLIHCAVGSEKMSDEEIADNILTLYSQLVSHLPTEENNIKEILVKLTMGKPVKVA